MPLYRVLVVEDDPDSQLILAKLLEMDYEVITATNGLDALKKIEDVEPDLVLTDVMMPVMNGWEFVERLRGINQFSKTPVIFLSALGQKKQIQNAYESGGNLYLNKPIEPERLQRMIELQLKERGLPPLAKTLSYEDLKAKQPVKKEVAVEERSEPKPAAKVEEKKDEPDAAVPRVLIVDDDEDLANIFRLELIQKYEVLVANDGLHAMDMTLKWKPDVFVIDWMMPKISGIQMVDILRRTDGYQDAPIILVSAKHSRKDRMMIEQLDVQEFIQKPFEPNILTEVIDRETAKESFEVIEKRLPLANDESSHLQKRIDTTGKKDDTIGWEG